MRCEERGSCGGAGLVAGRRCVTAGGSVVPQTAGAGPAAPYFSCSTALDSRWNFNYACTGLAHCLVACPHAKPVIPLPSSLAPISHTTKAAQQAPGAPSACVLQPEHSPSTVPPSRGPQCCGSVSSVSCTESRPAWQRLGANHNQTGLEWSRREPPRASSKPSCCTESRNNHRHAVAALLTPPSPARPPAVACAGGRAGCTSCRQRALAAGAAECRSRRERGFSSGAAAGPPPGTQHVGQQCRRLGASAAAWGRRRSRLAERRAGRPATLGAGWQQRLRELWPAGWPAGS